MRLLVAWLADVPRMRAAEQLRDVLAVQLGGALVMDPKQPAVKQAMRRLQRAAGG